MKLYLILIFFSQQPPGTIKVKDNLYIDEYEVSNVDYGEYLYWINRIFGQKSQEYRNAMPTIYLLSGGLISSKELTEKKLQRSELERISYLYGSAFNEFPVVGITYEQAVSYCKWRSDRVYESMLIDAKLISYYDQNPTSYFSISKILTGKIKVKDTVKLKKILVPIYRLPKIEEWEFAASGGLDTILFPYGVKDNISRRNINHDTLGLVKASITECVGPNNFNLFNMIGNVSEMVLEKGVSKGGCWFDDLKTCKIKDSNCYTGAQPWLGFRCVCEWRKY